MGAPLSFSISLLYPESENTWEKRKDAHPEISAAVEAKLLQHFGSITSEAYHMANRQAVPKSESEFGAKWTIHPDSSDWLYAGTDNLGDDADGVASQVIGDAFT